MRKDPVTPEMAAYVLARDRVCIAYRVDSTHRCRNRWGDEHAPDDVRQLTIDHVKREARMGKRAESVPACLVAACGWANNEGWCSAHRAEERAYLAMAEPA